MREDIFKHGFVVDIVCAEHDAVVFVEAAELGGRAGAAADVGTVEVSTEAGDVVVHVADYGAVGEEGVAVGGAARTVDF